MVLWGVVSFCIGSSRLKWVFMLGMLFIWMLLCVFLMMCLYEIRFRLVLLVLVVKNGLNRCDRVLVFILVFLLVIEMCSQFLFFLFRFVVVCRVRCLLLGMVWIVFNDRFNSICCSLVQLVFIVRFFLVMFSCRVILLGRLLCSSSLIVLNRWVMQMCLFGLCELCMKESIDLVILWLCWLYLVIMLVRWCSCGFLVWVLSRFGMISSGCRMLCRLWFSLVVSSDRFFSCWVCISLVFMCWCLMLLCVLCMVWVIVDGSCVGWCLMMQLLVFWCRVVIVFFLFIVLDMKMNGIFGQVVCMICRVLLLEKLGMFRFESMMFGRKCFSVLCSLLVFLICLKLVLRLVLSICLYISLVFFGEFLISRICSVFNVGLVSGMGLFEFWSLVDDGLEFVQGLYCVEELIYVYWFDDVGVYVYVLVVGQIVFFV